MNAIIERWVGSVRREILDRILIVNADLKDTVPLHVVYALTELGKTLQGSQPAICAWALEHPLRLTRQRHSLIGSLFHCLRADRQVGRHARAVRGVSVAVSVCPPYAPPTATTPSMVPT
jgi:HxlR-like helix-turn-helix protein